MTQCQENFVLTSYSLYIFIPSGLADNPFPGHGLGL